MSHRNASLTPTGRLKLARCVVERGWSYRQAAARFQVSHTTAKRWADRYRAAGAAGMADRSSRPHHSPARTERTVEQHIVRLRWRKRWGAARIAGCLGLHTSTVGAVLRRYHAPLLVHLDRATGEPVRRYEHAYPGSLVHVDIKKLANIPDGGGWRTVGKAAGEQHRREHPAPRGASGKRIIGSSYLHTAIDDHSRLAYTEILTDQTAATAVAFWLRAHAWFRNAGITIDRVLTDNGACYLSQHWRTQLRSSGIAAKYTRPYRPQTNGKVERFHRTLQNEWAYARPYLSNTERADDLPTWLHYYNHHRHHTAIGGPPANRVTNLSGENS